ncbi:GNAT family N-acetyltransferase [Spirilliplanes yamanashiensis]|uniref:GNAT family N-acetyltransferase n=1 Tax=Spirilliplanes yamanashiensis TaxID=42233 RepID=UPI0031D52D53
MPKSKSRKRTPDRRRVAAARRLRPAVDLAGLAGPSGYRIRLAQPADAAAVLRLLPLAEPTIGEDGALMLGSPMLAQGLLQAHRQRRTEPVLTGLGAKSADDLMMALSSLLVAVDADGAVAGVLMSLPPVRVLGQAIQAGVPLPEILLAAHTVIKIKGVAVDEAARGHGIGTALINACVQLYTGLGWHAIYGQIDKNSDLEDYYTRLGFTVLASRQGISLAHLVTFPLAIHPLRGERLFVHWADGAGQPA